MQQQIGDECRRRPRLAGLLGVLATALASATPAGAQPGPSLTITVVDPTGALIVGASVTIRLDDENVATKATGPNGAARLELPHPGRVTVRVESPGFETTMLERLDVRRDTRRTVKLALAKVLETVEVGRDPRERASDPRSDVFATILGAAEIRELPDDPDEMERVLRDMAGPGAVMRVNGFRGGRLPPKEQIAQIRFRRNMFAADAHEPGFLSVDVITKPGFDTFSGSTAVAFRDDAMNARNALAPAKGDERHTRGTLNVSGPISRARTSFAASADLAGAHDTQTLVGATLAGAFARSVERPTDIANGSVRLEHALSPTHQFTVELQKGRTTQDNLGVGDFNLESRAYRSTRDDLVLRGLLTGSLGTRAYHETRLSWRGRTTTSASSVQAPAISVLNAFTEGGAQLDGSRESGIVEVAEDVDISRGRHAWRAGILLQSGNHRTSELRNGTGTFTFADLSAYAAARATAFTRTTGDPAAWLRHTELASYVQDDLRVSPRLTLSGGLRQEWQTGIGGLHVAPRGGIAWSPFRSGRTTVRGGAGVFFDWFEADDALRAVQLDGSHQQVETILAPEFPAVPGGTGAVPSLSGHVQLAPRLEQPTLREMSLGVEQALGTARLNVMAVHRRGHHELRGVDINAPVDGVRPLPGSGPITEVRSTGESGYDALSVNLNVVRPERRFFLALNYTLARAWNEADSPFALAADARHPDAERGPAPTDARHRAMGFVSVPVWRGLMTGISFTARSSLPYDVTTGRDDNGDSLSTDRPGGVGRNAARGRAAIDVSARLAWRAAFGGPPPAGPSGPQVRIVRGGSDANPLGDMPPGARSKRFGLEIYAQVFNALNHLNASAFGSVIASPFFDRPVAAAPPRRTEVGVRLSF